MTNLGKIAKTLDPNSLVCSEHLEGYATSNTPEDSLLFLSIFHLKYYKFYYIPFGGFAIDLLPVLPISFIDEISRLKFIETAANP